MFWKWYRYEGRLWETGRKKKLNNNGETGETGVFGVSVEKA